jgi:hypothetical protein
VLRCRFTPVNPYVAWRFPLPAVAGAALFSVLIFPGLLRARPDGLEDGVERLARRMATLPHERRLSLVWTVHAPLSEQRMGVLRAAFVAQMEAFEVRFVQGEAAPALRVSVEQNPSEILLIASVPGEGTTLVAIEEVPRSSVASEDQTAQEVRLEKELVWLQAAKLLSAALPRAGANGEKRLLLLSEEALLAYRGGPGGWKLERSKPLPGPRQPPRSARGQLILAEERPEQAVVLLPGRRCEANLADDAPLACAWAPAELAAGRLMVLPGCGRQTWWLKSDSKDWASEDRLLLRAAGGKGAAPVAQMELTGPVISISAAGSPALAAVTLRNLDSGNYEVYRVALACTN